MDKNIVSKVSRLLQNTGHAILEIYHSDDFSQSFKKDKTPVTKADKLASVMLREGLKSILGNINIIDEEAVNTDYNERRNWKSFWMIDPIDGTWEFIKKNDEFCINLAYFEHNQPLLGWIYRPTTDVGWFCKKGKGIVTFSATEQQKIKIEDRAGNIINVVASRTNFAAYEQSVLNKIAEKYPLNIIKKGSSLKQVKIALNQADLYFKASRCFEWDTAPGQLMLEESGGVALQLSNFQPLQYNKPDFENPHFLMVSRRCNNDEFLKDTKNAIEW